MTYNDGLNTLNENISENFSINNNNYNEEENNKENINFNNNSFDDSLEYSKSKSFNVNETPAQISLKKNEILNENEEGLKIDNKDESLNIYTNFHNDGNNNSKNIERYKNTTSNKSKQINLNKKMIMIVNKVMENRVVYQIYPLLIINQIKVIGIYLIIITVDNYQIIIILKHIIVKRLIILIIMFII